MFNPDTAPYADYYLRPLTAAALRHGIKVSTAAVRSESDMEDAITALGREAGRS